VRACSSKLAFERACMHVHVQFNIHLVIMH